MQKISFKQILQVYSGFWFFSFFTTLLFTWISNGLWQIPLYQVVDTQLSVLFSLDVVVIGLYVLIAAIMLIAQQYLMALAILVGSLIGLTVTYAPVLAFNLYAMIASIDLGDSSKMMTFFNDRVGEISYQIASVASGVSPGSIDVTMEWVERALQVISILVALGSLWAGARRQTA